MVHSPSWEANRFAASQEIPRIFMQPEGSLPHSQASATVLSPEEASCLQVFLNMNVLHGGVVSTSPNPKLEDHPL